jgi:hypothetical protein
MCRYCQVEELYENGYDSEGSPLAAEEEGVSMTDEVRRQHEIINIVSREVDDKEGGYHLDEDQCAMFCRCGLELLRRGERHDCLGAGEMQELDVGGSDESNDED